MAGNDLAARFQTDAPRWEALRRCETPEWFRKARLGFFVHWGPYSVPAWGEPSGELGTIPPQEWYKHNPYSEWYYNTIRIDGSPAQQHHQRVHDGRPYDDFIDQWQAENFHPSSLVGELTAAGGKYIVLTTKHHDGVCLWDAPGTDGRNTVARGPKQDLVGAYADACREHGVRFGAYYSGGLDWHVRPFPPIGAQDSWEFDGLRPLDEEYAAYAAEHLRDLIRRYSPDVLWNDIEWPDEGKDFRENGIGRVFEEYYKANSDGLVNDRWHVPHSDYTTSEYQHLLDSEDASVWENCRGVGLSFAYNRAEGPEYALAGPEAIRHLVDVAVRGGRLLLGVGPMADGRLPDWQSRIVAEIGRWMQLAGHTLEEITATERTLDIPGAWVRLGGFGDDTLAFIDTDEAVSVPAGDLLTPEWATLSDGVLKLAADRPGPAVLRLD